MLHTTSFVDCSVILPLQQKPSAQQSVKLSPSSTTISVSPIPACRHAAVSCHVSMHIGSKQSYVNCLKILYRIDLGHNNLIDKRVNFDSPNFNTFYWQR